MNRLLLIIALGATTAACSPQAEPAATEASPIVPRSEGMMSGSQMGGVEKMVMMAPAQGDSAATRGYKAAMMSMMTDMPAYTGNADVDFMKQMRGHHQAAIAMARVELAEGQNAEAKALAQEIIAAQEREIAVIDTWLMANGG